MKNRWKAPGMMPDIKPVLSNFSFPFHPLFMDRMFCVKDQKELKEGQVHV